ncbi:MAG: DUF1592 domain-containing protein [Acidobacteria bacterium]|nr:DUF1592 domain-containing protein [Acidobacteriota bacterium]
MKRWIALAAVSVSAQVTPEFFASKVFPALESAQCRICHTRAGVASGTRLHFPEKDAPLAQIQSFGLGLAALIDRGAPANSLLIGKPTNRVKHIGGERIAPGSAEEKLLAEWAGFLAARAPAMAQVTTRTAPTQLARRLTHSQYNNTIRDLLGDPSKPAQRFPPEDFIDGFKNQLRSQSMPPLLVETYSTAAEKVALNAFRSDTGVLPCKTTDAKCRDEFLRTFGMRAFRRSLTKAEHDRYTAAFVATGNFKEGARTVVEAMLQSPKFLFYSDAASQLSYFLWDTMPDQALLDAAAKGDLRTPEGRERAARRMLDDPRAAQALDEFFSQWLRFDRVLNASKERRRFPEFSPELAAAMVEETRLLLHHLVSTNGNFLEFLTAGYGFLNSDLAALYGVPAPSTQFARVDFPGGAKRAGFLGNASFLAAMAGPSETSPTSRGVFVREQLLCQHVPPPPPNVNTNLPEADEDKPSSRRQRLNAHVENAACSSCHKLMDPIGFGLENFDARGKWREKELVHKAELPLETGGEIAGLPDSAFNGAVDLGGILARSTVCQDCIVRQVFRYARGRLENDSDEAAIRELSAKFRASGFKFRELLVAVARGMEDNAGRRRP